MRHRNAGRQLGRNSSQRKALFRSLSISLLMHGSIRTTLPKAKSLRGFIEPLITVGKTDSLANRRLVFSRLRNKEAVTHLFNKIGPAHKQRPGGYVRILKMGFRKCDAAPMAFVSLMDFASVKA